MASAQEIKRRIKAVTNTSQITKAMEMVSATKMRKSQETALLSRPYAMESLRILAYLENKTPYVPELMRSRDVRHRMIVLVASDKGLAGSFNTNIFRMFERALAGQVDGDPQTFSFVTVGKKAEEFVKRKQYRLERSFRNAGDFTNIEDTKPLAEFLRDGFLNAELDAATVVTTHFRTTLKQEVVVREVLPVTEENIWRSVKEIAPETGRFSGFGEMVSSRDPEHGHNGSFEYLLEPDPKGVLDALAPMLFEILVYDLMMEANASEHSARMVAMKNASENADELREGLNLEFNKIRQAKITQEIGEIVGGAEALNN